MSDGWVNTIIDGASGDFGVLIKFRVSKTNILM